MKCIIVSTDLSRRSLPALRRAAELCVAHGAALKVLHVVDNDVPAALADQAVASARDHLAAEVEEASGGSSLDVSVEVVAGDPFDAIPDYISATPADLLVVGMHRRRALFDQFRKTTVEHVIEKSALPVLVAVDAGDAPYEDALVGIDLTEVCTRAIKTVRALAPGVRLKLFHAHKPSFEAEAAREVDTWKAVYPVPFEVPDPVYVEASPKDALEEMMRDGGVDLLVIGMHSRTSVGRYFFGDVSAGLIRNPPCDVLIVK